VKNRFIYTYDLAGQRKSETRADGTEHEYQYDKYRQLIDATVRQGQGGTEKERYTYAFDSIGNRLASSKSVASGSEVVMEYESNNLNQYLSITNNSSVMNSTYDANGNVLNDGKNSYIWDNENRVREMRQMTETGLRVSQFVYDGTGRRVGRKDYLGGNHEKTVRYVYDGLRVIAEVDEAGVMQKSFTRGFDLSNTFEDAGGTGGLLAMTDATGQTGYYFADALGNITDILDAAGASLAHYEYSPFGERTTATGLWADENPWQFSSQEYSGVFELVGYLYRWYDPMSGCWLNRDPIEEEGGINLYGFVENNPVNWIDALGQQTSGKQLILDNFGYDGSAPLLGPYGIPIGLGGARVQIHFWWSGNAYLCTNKQGQQKSWASVAVGGEAYVIWGYSGSRTPPVKGRDRNKPHPDGGKQKNHADKPVPADSGYRSRTWHVDSTNPCRKCPEKEGWSGVNVYIFIRGSGGIGWVGYQASLQRTWNLSDGGPSSLTFTQSLAHNVAGLSIEVGGGLSGTVNVKRPW
jgi:RHS repeat-associated protein